MKIKYFNRKKNPSYFSIEQIFYAICRHLNENRDNNISAEIDEVPYYFSPLNFFRNILYVRGRQGPVNHITGDIHYAILGCKRSNLNVLTIHDCVILHKYRKWDIRYWIFRMLWYEWPIRKADLVTVISEKTRTELLDIIGKRAFKIRVVNNFVNDLFEYTPKEFNKDQPGLLFIGSTENKNLDRVLQAIIGLGCHLDIIGKVSDKQRTFINSNNLKVSFSHGLTLEQVVKKYQESDIVLFPSLYEGFGMLIIEANAVGRPVITSNISPMKEVAGTAAVLVDPFNVDSI